MIRFTNWAFKNKAAVILMVVLSLVLGIVSYFTVPKEFLPPADNPMVTVIVIGQDTDAETMAEQVTKPIEKAIGSVKGKKDVFSTAADGFTSVDILLDASIDMKEAKTQVQEAVNSIPLPEGYSKPIVSQLNIDMIPLWQIGLSFPGGIDSNAMEKVDNEVIPKFQGISGVSNVSVYGSQQTQVNVTVDQEKLATYQIPLQALLGILHGKNLAVSVGEATIDDKTTNIKIVGQIDGIASLEALEIVPGISLKEISTVDVADSSSTFFTHVNGKEAIALVLYKEPNANAVAIGKKVENAIQQVNVDHKSTIEAAMLISFSDFIVNSVDSMMQAVLLGALFATIIIFVFLRHIRMTAITVISIPLSLGLTLLLLWLSDITLNILTIGAVAVAVGRLVDDSIVVIENIFRKAQNGDFSKPVIVEATKEVASAITSSTLTTVAVFLPMGLVKSMQDLLLPFALTITYALLSSLLVALIVVPLMSTGLLQKGKLPAYKTPRRYIRILDWCLRHKWIPLVTSILIFIGSIGLYFAMPKGTEDATDQDVVLSLSYPDEVPFTTVKEEVLQLENFFMRHSDVEEVILFLGSNPEDAEFSEVNAQNSGRFHVVMKSGASTKKLIREIDQLKKLYPQAEMEVSFVSMMSSGGSTISLDIVGNDASQLGTAADQVMDEIEGITGVRKVSSNQSDVKTVYDIVIDQKIANAEEVARQVQLLLNPIPLGTIKLENQNTMVYLDSSIHPKTDYELNEIQVIVNEQLVPLSSIAEIDKADKPTSVLRKDGKEYVRVTIDVNSQDLSKISYEITQKTAALSLPDGISIEMGGAASAQADQFAELFQLMAVSIGLVYLIMVMTFKTLRAPLVILFTLPLAVIGAVFGLLIAQTPIDIGAMIGALMLIGIVVTNAIVLLDRVRQNEATMSIREALLEAGATRLRPIVMTALATIFAMIPLLMGKEEMGSLVSKGLAVVVIGGLTVSTLLTLIIIPVLYELFHFKKAKKQRMESLETQ
ncbi:efflux RND transporter permease subunit [Sporosarcina pasteurii]|uniref:Swarming motility protein SwrC n=1 Tax=Sporosarcina pasteurii TaxID=1474 RepID=A0A380C316_SPOPA|nr:efflux RND transporter permease subunit [Sporosarcina pasteurii]MDS9471521.1 efflux RND transporter permease subunit [Sporosarcina pasteurii]QBQ04860.1 efflux RND transporter permease subunit [Sporosarcina pasteurii]SUJ10643.1 Swarming motility protein SwrC [Sporosarcina pasteurii]